MPFPAQLTVIAEFFGTLDDKPLGRLKPHSIGVVEEEEEDDGAAWTDFIVVWGALKMWYEGVSSQVAKLWTQSERKGDGEFISGFYKSLANSRFIVTCMCMFM